MKDKQDDLTKIRAMADYQFGKGVGKQLFPDKVEIIHSKRTGRIRYVYLNGKRLVTLRPRNGHFSLAIEGARRIIKQIKPPRLWVKINNEAEKFVRRGKSVFAKHIVDADKEIRPQEEVIVLNLKGKVIAVGRAILTGEEMKTFKRGVAVKIRKGAAEEENKVKKVK